MISRPEIQAFLGTYQEGAEKFPVHLQLHPGVDPSSIFLTGSSGSGKSTAGQCMAIQFAKQKIPLLALDLGHTLSPDHICPPLSSEFEALAIRHDLYNESVATDILNPKPCGSNTESPYDTAYGLCQIIGQSNRFGPAQIASLTAEVKTIVEYREIYPHIFSSILEALKSSTSANVRMLGNRLEPLLQHDMFERRQNGSSSLPISPHKQQDFLTLTGAARRARSEGYDITYHGLRNLVAAGYISHVPNGSRIYVFYPNVIRFLQRGLTAEQSLDYQLSRARN